LIPIGPDVDPAEAVALVGTGRTAMAILAEAQITPEDTVVIPAAAGGLGTLLVQAAKRAGATVAGLAGGSAKVDLVRRVGADVAVDYSTDGWPERLGAALGERPVSVVLDGVGGAVGRAALELIQPGGRMVPFRLHGRRAAADQQRRPVRPRGQRHRRDRPAPHFSAGAMQAFAAEAVRRLADRAWRPVVSTFPLADAAAAHRASVDRAITGKVVLDS
jgi:NADPH2:quinone reductase